MNLAPIPTPKDKEENKEENEKPENDQTTPFLHEKHMQRDFLIFKEVSFSKRGFMSQEEEEDEDPIGNKIDTNAAAN